jgi:hypothetical protein
LWQFWCCLYSNERRGAPTSGGCPRLCKNTRCDGAQINLTTPVRCLPPMLGARASSPLDDQFIHHYTYALTCI